MKFQKFQQIELVFHSKESQLIFTCAWKTAFNKAHICFLRELKKKTENGVYTKAYFFNDD